MGIFPNRGLQYEAVLRDKHVIIASREHVDQRLAASKFLENEGGLQGWLDPWKTCRGDFKRQVQANSHVDIRLTTQEQGLLDKLILCQEVLSHGWYDINTISYSY